MTKLLYFTHPNQYNTQATIIDIVTTDRGVGLVFDQTIFYVQGGGQPSDRGIIKTQGKEFCITRVVRTDDGAILHYGDFVAGDLNVGTCVELCIDQDYRINNSKLHSAGHMIDVLMASLYPTMIPGKGHHYPDGSYVEFDIQNSNIDNIQNLIGQLNNAAVEFIKQDIQVEFTSNPDKIMYGQPLREMTFIGCKVSACGGTHVTASGELQGFLVTKAKLKGTTLKISYSIKTL